MPLNILGKRGTEWRLKHHSIFVIGDSHLSFFHLRLRDVATAAIRGGCLRHLERLIERDGLRGIGALVIFMGGNDLASDLMSDSYMLNLKAVVGSLGLVKPSIKVITTSMIPREVEKGHRTFFFEARQVDLEMKQQHGNHHHAVFSDLFLKYTARATFERTRMYYHDNVHLNNLGRDVMMSVFEFILDGISFDNFEGMRGIHTFGGPRRVTWKF